MKKAQSNWWPRLLKKEGKPPVFLKVDWDKWVDEDDEKENKCKAYIGIIFSVICILIFDGVTDEDAYYDF